MAVTVPTAFQVQQGNRDIVAGEPVDEVRVGLLRDNTHWLYAANALRPLCTAYYRDPLETSSTTNVVILELPLRFAANRRAAGLVVYFYRTGTCTVTLELRDAADTTTLASSGPSTGGVGATSQAVGAPTQDDCLLRFKINVPSGTAGVRWVRVSEVPLVAADLP